MNNSHNSFGRIHMPRQFQPPAGYMCQRIARDARGTWYQRVLLFWLALFLMALCSGLAPAQTLNSGGNFDGTILLNHTNTWTFTAASGDRIVLRGAELTGTTTFQPWLRIYDPNGVLVADSGVNGDVVVQELALTATNSGTFTVRVNDSNGTVHASANRRRSAPARRATAQPTSAPATAHSMRRDGIGS